MRIVVCGHGRHGKDEFCDYLGLRHDSSSSVALHKIIWPLWGISKYETREQCWNDRFNHRSTWATLITENMDSPLYFANHIFGDGCEVYCGMRHREELQACREAHLIDLVIWVDASDRIDYFEPSTSLSITKEDADIIIDNNGTKEDLWNAAASLNNVLNKHNSLQTEIAAWADSVFPHRTIKNAIQKMVLEEIPEYLMAQDDPMELADIGILLYDIAYLAGVDLNAAMRTKMAINAKRDWTFDESTGLMKHIKGNENDS